MSKARSHKTAPPSRQTLHGAPLHGTNAPEEAGDSATMASAERVERLGMFGGTFNPPHVAHLIAAQLAAEAFGIDKMLFVPANIPPHKADHSIASSLDRLTMTALAIDGNPCFQVSDIETERSGKSYSVDTILELKERYRPQEFFLFIGLDNLAIFRSWHQAEKILEEATVVVLARPTHDLELIEPELRQVVTFLPIPLLEVSSTEIRNRIAAGRTVRYLVPDSVGSYIEERGLYRDA